MQQTVRLFRIWGIDVGLHYTWLIIFGLVTWTLSSMVFPAEFPHWTRGLALTVGTLTSLLFFGSVLLHELGHSWEAQRRGIPVSDITLFIFGGAARITREASRPRDEIAIAAAGPIVSGILAAVFSIIAALTRELEPVAAMAVWLARVNIILAVFNLLPGFPLDGGRLLRAVAWAKTGDFRRATRIATRSGQVLAYLLIGLGLLTAFQGVVVSGIWLTLIGWFLLNAAEAGYRDVWVQSLLKGIPVHRLMHDDYLAVPPHLTVEDLVDRHILAHDVRYALIMDDQGALQGIVTLTDIRSVGRSDWPRTTVGSIMTRTPLATVGANSPVGDVVRLMATKSLRTAPVLEGSKVIGVIDREDVLRYLNLRQELEP